jgi:glutamate dehydrogenase
VPYAEIYVYSNEFEGIHLRGGKIARGGIRWSDRAEDYRTEALGLMKAQITKNSVIVPTGSKGAFFVKIDKSNISKEVYFNQVVCCYKNFLRGLLDLTDNIIAGEICHPKDLVILDDKDPYLVVAADKGTASFSDYANEVSAEYNFWLGDTFASGGKTGYDHKKLAITAKGAWVSVQRHFIDMNIDANTYPLTVVGIGDMSGDVFGNGLLSSKNLKLVAAFNHLHIFLDPSPTPQISYAERERLFYMPGSNWSDYNIELISKGGGVFARSAKNINLSMEIKSLLDIIEDQLTPDELISAILKARVDLIWNGGIGTYIKASAENNLDIADKANDNLRCNALEIRALVIAEGGNMGVSQLGRIEYSKNNGRINTDFIDNSAGVDCSDHEVNIKIILNEAIKQEKITLDERNEILRNMTKEVENLVLQDNFKQTRSITIMEKASSLNINMFSYLIKYIEKEGLLNRSVEFLPSEKEMENRIKYNDSLTRPELAILLSYSKILCKKQLSTSKILHQEYFIKFLYDYFPKSMHEKFISFIDAGMLKKEILSNVLTNDIINILTGPILYSIVLNSDKNFDDIISSYFIVADLFKIDVLWNKIEKLDANINVTSAMQIELFSNVIKFLRRGIAWLLKNHPISFDVQESINFYKDGLFSLLPNLPKVFLGATKERYLNSLQHYKKNGICEEIASEICSLEFSISAFDIISVAKNIKVQTDKLAFLYFQIGSDLEIDWLRKVAESDITNNSYWGLLSTQTIKDDLYQKQRKLLEIIAINFQDCNLNSWQKVNSYNYNKFKNFIIDLKMQKIIDLGMIIVANKKLELLL